MMPSSLVFAGRYEIHGRVGGGGFGDVFHARDHHMGLEVALKLFRVPSLILATDEATVLTALRGPHVLQVYNADMYQDVPFLATAVAELGSADDWIKASGHAVPVNLVVRWARHALVGLSICHRLNLLHRDIKPSNLFLSSEDNCQLGDFGIATLMDATGHAPTHGSFAIRAPEGFATGMLDIRSDIYSVGVTMFALLVGSFPYGESEGEVRAAFAR